VADVNPGGDISYFFEDLVKALGSDGQLDTKIQFTRRLVQKLADFGGGGEPLTRFMRSESARQQDRGGGHPHGRGFRERHSPDRLVIIRISLRGLFIESKQEIPQLEIATD
jgi:hypothetical protein